MNSLFKTFSKLFLISIALRAVDVFKNLYVASKLGVSDQADVFLSLSTIPDSLLILFGLDSLKGIVNSEYSSELNKTDYNINESFNNLFRGLLIIGIAITAVILIFRKELLSILLPGFTGERLTLALTLSLFIFSVFFMKPVVALLYAYYNSIKKYYYPIVPQVLVSLSIIFFVIFPVFSSELIINIAAGFLIGNILYFLVLILPQISKNSIEWFTPLRLDDLTKKILNNCMILFSVVVINQIYLFTKNFIVSYFDEGSLAALNYGTSIPTFVSSLTFAVVFGILLNNLSKLHSMNLVEDANKLLSNTINSIIFIYVPVVIVLVFFNINILNILYLRGNFDSNGINLTSNPFIWESLALIPFVFFIMPVAKYLAYKDYKKYSRIGILVYLAGIIINFSLVKIVGFYGVSVGTFVVYSLMAFSLIYFSDSSTEKIHINDSFKLILIGAFIALITYLLKKYVIDGMLVKNSIYELIAGTIFVFITYFFISVIFKLNYLNKLKNILKSEN
ncbi:MAG TPA: lipid II flippase MurJ [Ignavibacteria bacterium]|nr:lipid II flippase MurJ [Ignavibacteria bacterium]HMR40234.1 lipid II flippase MurJ [Ignavibacteria bacterium]